VIWAIATPSFFGIGEFWSGLLIGLAIVPVGFVVWIFLEWIDLPGKAGVACRMPYPRSRFCSRSLRDERRALARSPADVVARQRPTGLLTLR
jgi:hypothetical protein